MAFTMRTTKPSVGNKYYIRKANGGYSNAIKGSPADKDCDVLANCVGYAYGRFNEIGEHGSCKYLAPVNAEKFIQYKGSCEVGQTPKVGACMVWQKGATLNGSDGAGHVAIVEKVISSTEVYTSESGYGSSKPFWNSTRKKGSNGNWGAGAGYKFLGFIYNPAVKDDVPPKTTTSTKKSNNEIAKEVLAGKWGNGTERKKKLTDAGYDYVAIQKIVNQNGFKPYEITVSVPNLNIRKGAGTNYPVVGNIKDRGRYGISEESSGAGSTKGWGKLKSGAGWISLDYVTKV